MIRLLEHPADIGFEVDAPNLEALFEEAVRALFQIAAEPVPIEPLISEAVEVDGADYADVLVNGSP